MRLMHLLEQRPLKLNVLKLNELFDSKPSIGRWQWTHTNSLYERKAIFDIGDIKYEANFAEELSEPARGTWSFYFQIYRKDAEYTYYNDDDPANPVGNSGTGNQFKVFSVVLDIIRDFIQKEQPGILFFTASEKLKKDQLYIKMLSRLKNELDNKYGYVSSSNRSVYADDHIEFQLIRKDHAETMNDNVTEVFTADAAKKRWSWDADNTDTDVTATFRTDKDIRYQVYFILDSEDIANGTWVFQFEMVKDDAEPFTVYNVTDPANPSGNTGTGNQFQVFSTVIDICREFVRLMKPGKLVFSANNKLGKTQTYIAILKKLEKELSSQGYSFSNKLNGDGKYTEFALEKTSAIAAD